MKKSIIYIDGFNLYYGAVKDTPWKWLNIEKYFELLRQDDEILEIKYFTAIISGPRKENQLTFLQALETLSKVKIILGEYKLKSVKCNVRECGYEGKKYYLQPEEKKTDVSIALNMFDDAINEKCDRMVLISGDSDLVPALKLIKERKNDVEIVLYIPSNHPLRGASVELRSYADKSKILPIQLLKKSQFPNSIPSTDGGLILKPESW